MNECLLSIGITSYNRTDELKRCLESIDAKCIDKIQILVSEDKSPRRKEIQNIVEQYAENSPYEVVFHTNPENLGYDRNLKNIIDLAKGEYVLYISDDDMVLPGQLDEIIMILDEKKPKGVIYSPFIISRSKEYRRKYNYTGPIEPASSFVHTHIYDSILFSGLIFERSAVLPIDAEKFLNKIYFQVYMFIYCGHFFGGYYSDKPLIDCVDDGETGFGSSASSDNPDLKAKETPLANPGYDKGLIYCVKAFDEDYGTDYFKSFEKEYNIRSCTFLGKARDIDRNTLKEYWKKLKQLDIRLNWITYTYYGMYLILGSGITRKLLSVPRKVLLALRGEKQQRCTSEQ